jgi:hypothetical protein
VIGVKQQAVHHETHQASVSAVLLDRFAYVMLDLGIRIPEICIHFDLDDALFVRRQVRGDILERHKCRGRHKELAEDQR